MKKIIFIFIICIVTLRVVVAQQVFHHEIAIDASPIFHSSNGYTLMYRYHFTKVSARVQANIYVHNTDNETSYNVTTPVNISQKNYVNTSTDIWNTEFRIGLQRNWEFDKWGFYLGGDFLTGSSSQEDQLEDKNPQSFGTSRNVSKNTSSSTNLGGVFVLGVSYKLSNRFTFSLENGFAYIYSQNTANTRTDYYFTPIKGSEYLNSTNTSNTTGTSSTFDFSPAKYLRLFVGFRF